MPSTLSTTSPRQPRQRDTVPVRAAVPRAYHFTQATVRTMVSSAIQQLVGVAPAIRVHRPQSARLAGRCGALPRPTRPATGTEPGRAAARTPRAVQADSPSRPATSPDESMTRGKADQWAREGGAEARYLRRQVRPPPYEQHYLYWYSLKQMALGAIVSRSDQIGWCNEVYSR